MSNEKDLDILLAINTLNDTLSQISSALGYMAVNSVDNQDKSKTQLIHFLYGLGYSKKQIAVILDTTVNTVGARVSEMKKANKNSDG